MLFLLADPITAKDSKTGGWGHQLEGTGNIRPFLWTASSYLTSATADNANEFLHVITQAPELAQNLASLLTRFKAAFAAKDFAKVSKIVSEEIRTARTSKNIFKLLSSGHTTTTKFEILSRCYGGSTKGSCIKPQCVQLVESVAAL